jgi:hypothetical protein
VVGGVVGPTVRRVPINGACGGSWGKAPQPHTGEDDKSYLAGSGVNLCPSASVMAANIFVAGEEQTLSRGSLARMGDSAQMLD